VKTRFRFTALTVGVVLAILGCEKQTKEAQDLRMQEDIERASASQKEKMIARTPPYPVPLPVEPPTLATPDARQASAVLSDLEEREKQGKAPEPAEKAKPMPMPEEPKGGKAGGPG
jgi:hypothetical protein